MQNLRPDKQSKKGSKSQGGDTSRRRQVGCSIIYILLAIGGIWLLNTLVFRPMMLEENEIPYNQFLTDLENGYIKEATIEEERISFTYYSSDDEGAPSNLPDDKAGESMNTVKVDSQELVEAFENAGVEYQAEPGGDDLLTTILSWVIPILPFVLLWFFLMRGMTQGRSQIMQIGKSKAQEISGEITDIDFDDIGGLDEVEYELKEIIAFLQEPERFTRLGAKLPKGVLLVGPPGSGKTLLAKATAGEADVPFFSISGSDFIQMFVGVGAARVRDLFEQAKEKAPCIVFIDELDTIGQSRAGGGGAAMRSNEEREQTLNQLLSEMDGFDPNTGVVIMAATNRPDVLDPALLRPGRFDRQVQVPLPTEEGRLQILQIHAEEVPLADDVDLDRLAQITSGFSGADLANIVNEAALLASRREADEVNMGDFDHAIQRVIAGLQRKTPLSDEVRRKVAYHEGGHALVATLLPDTDPVHKVSIIPTVKGALGYTLQMPDEDQYLIGEGELHQRLAVLMGGRAAELLIFDEPSSGAANDLQKVTQVARRMVTEFGMTESLGPVRYLSEAGENYLQRRIMLRPEISPDTQALIDKEVRRIVDAALDTARDLLQEHKDALDEIAETLQREEVISGDRIKQIVGQDSDQDSQDQQQSDEEPDSEIEQEAETA